MGGRRKNYGEIHVHFPFGRRSTRTTAVLGNLWDLGWVDVDGGSLPFPIQMRVGQWEDGTLVCTGLDWRRTSFPSLTVWPPLTA